MQIGEHFELSQRNGVLIECRFQPAEFGDRRARGEPMPPIRRPLESDAVAAAGSDEELEQSLAYSIDIN